MTNDRLEIDFILDHNMRTWACRFGWPSVPAKGDLIFLGAGKEFTPDRMGLHLFEVTKVIWNSKVYSREGTLAVDVYVRSTMGEKGGEK